MADNGGGYPFDVVASCTVATDGSLAGEHRNIASSARTAGVPTGGYTVTLGADHAVGTGNVKIDLTCGAPAGSPRYATWTKVSATQINILVTNDAGVAADSNVDLIVRRCN